MILSLSATIRRAFHDFFISPSTDYLHFAFANRKLPRRQRAYARAARQAGVGDDIAYTTRALHCFTAVTREPLALAAATTRQDTAMPATASGCRRPLTVFLPAPKAQPGLFHIADAAATPSYLTRKHGRQPGKALAAD